MPIVPGAILFDLLNGGDKNWGRYPPYRELGYAATAGAAIAVAAAVLAGILPGRVAAAVDPAAALAEE